jgi:hypothetical protein
MSDYYVNIVRGSGSGYHKSGAPFAIGASTITGYTFDHWDSALVANIYAANTTATVYGPGVTITAIFTRNLYTTHYFANAGGEIIGNDEQTYYYGLLMEGVSADPDAGYRFIGWSDGNLDTSRRDYSSGNNTYYANFEFINPTPPDFNGITDGGYTVWM